MLSVILTNIPAKQLIKIWPYFRMCCRVDKFVSTFLFRIRQTNYPACTVFLVFLEDVIEFIPHTIGATGK